MWEEFTNALAWYAAAPARWVESAKEDLSAAAEWIWIVLQGDFAEEQSTAQTVTNTVISMIPIVDQICDVRDVVANCRKINQDTSDKFAWLALALTLIGLFPCLGSLAKGCLKIPFNYARKFALKGGAKVLDSGLWTLTKPYVEASIVKLNQHLGHPAVRKTLAVLKIDNIWKHLAEQVRTLKSKLNLSELTKVFDEIIDALNSFVSMMKKWGNEALQTKAGQMLQSVKAVRDQANRKLAEILKPLQNWLDNLARRLDIEADMNYRAVTNSINPHAFKKPTQAAEISEFKKNKPAWVDETKVRKNPPAQSAPSKPGWPDLDPKVKPNERHPLKEAYATFKEGTIKAETYKPGTVLYRIVDPTSADNSICWLTKEEFDKLKSKDDWRRTFAVWANWNSNGEFVTYTVPPGDGLRAWEGVVGTQEIAKTNYKLEGGARQIVLDPNDLKMEYIGKRQPTKWGYSNFGEAVDLLGVPTLKNNWRGK
jgi:hypothetical protein